MRTPHQVLGISANAKPDEIKQAYRKLALKWHPDRHMGDKVYATKIFVEINDAYQALIRELPFSSGIAELIEHAVSSTPPHSAESSTESLPSIDTPFRFSESRHSSADSYFTPSSSFGSGANLPPKLGRAVYPTLRNDLPSVSRGEHSHHATDTANSPGLCSNPSSASHSAFPTSPPPKSSNITHSELKTQWHSTGGQPKCSYPNITRATAPKHLHGQDNRADSWVLRPGPPPESGRRPSKVWLCPLTLTLEELFRGKHCRFCIVRRFISGRTKNIVIGIDIPPGCQQGTRILCRGVGHELRDGTFQDIAFLIQEASHDRFIRLQDDLLIDLRLPWTESLRRQPKKVYLEGLDGEEICIYIDYSRDKMVKGVLSIRGAGMPVREAGKVFGRGNLIVRWEILPPQTRVRRFLGRFLHSYTMRVFAGYL